VEYLDDIEEVNSVRVVVVASGVVSVVPGSAVVVSSSLVISGYQLISRRRRRRRRVSKRFTLRRSFNRLIPSPGFRRRWLVHDWHH
jgi:hypothetical protein